MGVIRSSLKTIRDCFAGLAELFLPGVCIACGCEAFSTDGLCEKCNLQLLSLVSLSYCPRCGTTLGPNIPARMDGCGVCSPTLPRFDEVIRLGPYAGPLRGIIGELKYRRRDAVRRHLGTLLAQALSSRTAEGGDFDLILPVPMHWRRKIERACDHSHILASTIADILELPIGDELIRIRHTPPQTHLPRSRRIENIRGAFGLKSTKAIEGAKVLLIDDVTTTGATANEAARTILSGGASKVTLGVVAKSEPPTAYQQHWQ